MTEAEVYATRLREISTWNAIHELSVSSDLRAAADLITRQQAEIEALIHDWKQTVVMAELSYDAHYLHSGGG